jgi:hypothetical protein
MTTWLGLHFGLVLVHFPGDHAARLKVRHRTFSL